MKFFAAVLLALVCVVSTSFGQTGARILGAQQFVLDDGTFANPRIYLSSNNGSMGIDPNGIVSGGFPNTTALLTLASSKPTGILISGSATSINADGSVVIGDLAGNDGLTLNLWGTGQLVITNLPAPGIPAPLTNLMYINGANQVQQTPGGINVITGSGTTNTVPMWTPNGFQLGNSILTQPNTSSMVVTPVAGGTNVLTVNGTGTSTALAVAANAGTGVSVAGASTAITITTGNIILGSTVNTIASGGSIPNGQAVVDVNDNGVGASVATVTLPGGATNGQVVYVTTEDPDGVKITVGLSSVTLSNAEVGRFMFINGTWRLEH